MGSGCLFRRSLQKIDIKQQNRMPPAKEEKDGAGIFKTLSKNINDFSSFLVGLLTNQNNQKLALNSIVASTTLLVLFLTSILNYSIYYYVS